MKTFASVILDGVRFGNNEDMSVGFSDEDLIMIRDVSSALDRTMIKHDLVE